MEQNNPKDPIEDAPLKTMGGSFEELLEKQLAAEKQQEAQEKTDLSLPLSEKVSNKSWKVRKSALEEISSRVQELTSFDPELFKLFPKILTDQHQLNLEEAVNIFSSYLEKNFQVPKEHQQDLNTIIKNLIEKCFTSSKEALKNKSKEVIIDAVEYLNSTDVLCENLISLLESKNQKLNGGAVEISLVILSLFGSKAINYKRLSASMAALSDKCLPMIKKQIIDFFIELYKWIKKDIKPLIEKKVKDNVKNDIQKGIDQINNEKGLAYFPKPTKFLGKKPIAPPKDSLAANLNKNNNNNNNCTDNDIELDYEEVDIFTKKLGFDEKFVERMLKKETKWKEKKQAFDDLTALTDPTKIKKIKNTNRLNFIDMVKKLLKEPNINVVHSIINAIGNISLGLGSSFYEGRELMPKFLEFFKEKKENFISSLNTCLLNLTSFIDDNVTNGIIIKYASGNICNPAKIHICSFVEKLIEKRNGSQLNCYASLFSGVINKYLDDPSKEIRDEATKLMAFVKSQKTTLFNSNQIKSALNEQKNKKIDEYVNNIYKKSNNNSNNTNIHNNNNNHDDFDHFNNSSNDEVSEVDKGKKKKKKTKSEHNISNNNNNNNNPKMIKSVSADNLLNISTDIDISNSDEIISLMQDFLPKETLPLFESKKWSERKEAFTDLNNFINNDKNIDILNTNYDSFIKFILINNKSFKDNNILIVKESFLCIESLIEKVDNFAKNYFHILLKIIIDKISERKLLEQISNFIHLSIGKISPKEVLIPFMNQLRNKSTLILKEGANMINNILENENNIHLYPVKEIVDFCCFIENNSNSQIRNIGTNILCCLYKYLGGRLKMLLKDLKESTLKAIEKEFEKITPISTSNSNDKNNTNTNTNSNTNSLLDQIFPRIDISKKITPPMLKKLKEGKWDEKKEILAQIESILISANKKIQPKGLNDLFSCIKNNLKDGNKNIVKMNLKLISDLAEALGANGFKNYHKYIMSGLLSTLVDKNTQAKTEALNCINTLISVVGFDSIASYFPRHLAEENMDSRRELLNILIKNKSFIGNKREYIKEFIGPIINCLVDKNKNIREMTEELVQEILKYYNKNIFNDSIKNLKPVIENQVRGIISKYDRIYNNNNISNENLNTLNSNTQMSSNNNRFSNKNMLSSSVNPFQNDTEMNDSVSYQNDPYMNNRNMNNSINNFNSNMNLMNIYNNNNFEQNFDNMNNFNNFNNYNNNDNYNNYNNMNMMMRQSFESTNFNNNNMLMNNSMNNISNMRNMNRMSYMDGNPFPNNNNNNNFNNINLNNSMDLSQRRKRTNNFPLDIPRSPLLKQINEDNNDLGTYISDNKGIVLPSNKNKNNNSNISFIFEQNSENNSQNNSQNQAISEFSQLFHQYLNANKIQNLLEEYNNNIQKTITIYKQKQINEANNNNSINYNKLLLSLNEILNQYLFISLNSIKDFDNEKILYDCYENLFLLLLNHELIDENKTNDILKKVNDIIMNLLHNCGMSLSISILIKIIIEGKSKYDKYEYEQICEISLKCLKKFENILIKNFDVLKKGVSSDIIDKEKIMNSFFDFFYEFGNNEHGDNINDGIGKLSILGVENLLRQFVYLYSESIRDIYDESLDQMKKQTDTSLKNKIEQILKEKSGKELQSQYSINKFSLKSPKPSKNSLSQYQQQQSDDEWETILENVNRLEKDPQMSEEEKLICQQEIIRILRTNRWPITKIQNIMGKELYNIINVLYISLVSKDSSSSCQNRAIRVSISKNTNKNFNTNSNLSVIGSESNDLSNSNNNNNTNNTNNINNNINSQINNNVNCIKSDQAQRIEQYRNKFKAISEKNSDNQSSNLFNNSNISFNDENKPMNNNSKYSVDLKQLEDRKKQIDEISFSNMMMNQGKGNPGNNNNNNSSMNNNIYYPSQGNKQSCDYEGFEIMKQKLNNIKITSQQNANINK